MREARGATQEKHRQKPVFFLLFVHFLPVRRVRLVLAGFSAAKFFQ